MQCLWWVVLALACVQHAAGVLPVPISSVNASGPLGYVVRPCQAMRTTSLYMCAQAYVFGHVADVNGQKGLAQALLVASVRGYQWHVNRGGWPNWRVLEIGCGGLNLAREIIPMLPADGYVCVEPNSWLNVAGLAGDPDFLYHVLAKRPIFLQNSAFDASAAMGRQGRKFDIVFAHSILSHTPLSQLRAWLERVSEVLAPAGVAIASLYHHDYRTGRYNVGTSAHTEWEYPGVTTFSVEVVAAEARRVGLTHYYDPMLRELYTMYAGERHDWAVFRWPSSEPTSGV
mmetsp:Transcript_27078/g.84236  ORF Transcript_27078/g.84236 Transcript_27078/m.84236 type:complete len:286 (-) Transcript_27078:189-1046(-)